MKEKIKEGDYKGVHWESQEELQFLYWAFELLDIGVISSIERAESFSLSSNIINKYSKITILKSKVKTEEKSETILNKHIYTPEFKIIWNKNANIAYLNKLLHLIPNTRKDDKFIVKETEDSYITYIEVKSNFDFQNMSRLFKINQKWVYDKYKEYINLVIPSELFKITFTPNEFLTTPTGKPKKIIGKLVLINDYLNGTTQ